MPRSEFSDRIKRDRWDYARKDPDGDRETSNCEGPGCGVLLRVGSGKYQFDHHMPDGLAGPATFENCRLLCNQCHADKTARDNAMIKKADKQRARSLGKKKAKGRPMPGTKASGIRKRMNGTVERR